MDDNPGFNPEILKNDTEQRYVPPEQDFERAFREGTNEFVTENDVAESENLYYNEASDDRVEQTNSQPGEEYNAGVANAAALINYGLNEAARELGVETVVQKIKSFDVTGREDPIGDLFEYLGIDTPVERQDLAEEREAAKVGERAFRAGVNAPTQRRSVEGAFKALEDMKELIAEVEGADPRYESLREGARAASKGYFEYAVMNFGVRGLTELFDVLAAQREKAEVATADYDRKEMEARKELEDDQEIIKKSEEEQRPIDLGGPEASIGDGERLDPGILERQA